jgi:hypothetical protein
MSPNDGYPDDDSFERALREYREQTWDPADFADLPAHVQSDIVERAFQIKAAHDRFDNLMAV